MKKFFYVTSALVVIGVGAYIGWFYYKNNAGTAPQSASLPQPTQNQPTEQQTPSVPQTDKQQTQTTQGTAGYSITDTFPKTDTISIATGNGSVDVKNFYKKFVDTEEGYLILSDKRDYQISYDRSSGVFYIHFRSILANQTTAENELVSMLGVSKNDVCKLGVYVFLAGRTKAASLSFCPDKVQ